VQSHHRRYRESEGVVEPLLCSHVFRPGVPNRDPSYLRHHIRAASYACCHRPRVRRRHSEKPAFAPGFELHVPPPSSTCAAARFLAWNPFPPFYFAFALLCRPMNRRLALRGTNRPSSRRLVPKSCTHARKAEIEHRPSRRHDAHRHLVQSPPFTSPRSEHCCHARAPAVAVPPRNLAVPSRDAAPRHGLRTRAEPWASRRQASEMHSLIRGRAHSHVRPEHDLEPVTRCVVVWSLPIQPR
jgi:hypothetical protein